MKVKVSLLQRLIQEETQKLSESGYKAWHPETMKSNASNKGKKETHGEFTAAGDCDHDFFGVLLGYLGGDEQSAKDFCDMATATGPGDHLGAAMEEFNISPDAEFEIRQAYNHIFTEDPEDLLAQPFENPFEHPMLESLPSGAEASRFKGGEVKEEEKCPFTDK